MSEYLEDPEADEEAASVPDVDAKSVVCGNCRARFSFEVPANVDQFSALCNYCGVETLWTR